MAISQSPINGEKDGTNDYSIPGHLPNVLMRLKGLEAKLQEPNVVLVDSNGSDDVILIKRRLILDGTMSVLMDGARALQEPWDLKKMIQRCICISKDVKDETKWNGLDNNPVWCTHR
jgi:hypothetical protein